jgi:hypothetical protein
MSLALVGVAGLHPKPGGVMAPFRSRTLSAESLRPTEQVDREYFREPGAIL